eukprot:scaffold64430_cov47-Phaeocystis_antarctica.AAC.4
MRGFRLRHITHRSQRGDLQARRSGGLLAGRLRLSEASHPPGAPLAAVASLPRVSRSWHGHVVVLRVPRQEAGNPLGQRHLRVIPEELPCVRDVSEGDGHVAGRYRSLRDVGLAPQPLL